MSSTKKLCWLSLSVTLVAVALLVTACGGDNGASPKTPGPSAAVPGPTLTAEANDRTGVTDTTITLGTHFPLSGSPAAAYAPIAYGMKAFFDYINAQGGIYGRKINFIIGDDHYSPPDTVEVVRKLVEQDHVFGIINGLGDDPHLAIFKYLEDKGIPDMYLSAGLDSWTNPVAHNRFGGYPDYQTEGLFLGQYIAKTYPSGKLGILEQSDTLGVDGDTGLRKGIAGSSVQVVDVEKYDVVQSDVTAQTERLKNAGADVMAVFGIPPQAASATKVARETLNWNVPIVVSGLNASDFYVLLAGEKDAEGVVSFIFSRQAYELEDPGVQKYEKIWAKFHNTVTGDLTNSEGYGMLVAEATTWDLEMAGKDLSRQSFLDAAESMCQVKCSTCTGFGTWNTSPTDHKIIETFVIDVVKGGKWLPVGDTTSYESTTSCTPKTPPEGFDQQPKLGIDAPYVDTP